MKGKNKKILVGMSGGVDSSVAVLLLQKEGYEVEGVFVDFVGGEKSEKDFRSAQKIAQKLKIPIDKIDARKVFKKEIIDKFVEDYKKGITPNPCVFCNPQMKFKILIEEADRRGVKKVATGHYSRVRELKIKNEKLKIEEKLIDIQNTKYKIQDTSKFKISNLRKRIEAVFERKLINVKESHQSSANGHQISSVNRRLGTRNYSLLVAKDDSKDQSYFLYRLTQDQLSRIVFPLGEYLKTEVREIAEKNNFEIKDEEESQDVCFIADNDFNKFISQQLANKLGKIVDNLGKVLGQHEGLHFYTIGQRKGINLGGDGPYFVIKKDLINNNLVVANNPIESLWRDEFEIKDVNWINFGLKFPLEAKVRIRYRTEEIYAIIDALNENEDGGMTYKVKLDQPQKAITPGQSAVFYSEEGVVLGGGIII